MVERLRITEIASDPQTQGLLKQLGNGDDLLERAEIDRPTISQETGEVVPPDGYIDCDVVPKNWSGHQFGLVQSALHDSGLLPNLRGKICGRTFKDDATEAYYQETLKRLQPPKERIPLIQYLAVLSLGYTHLNDTPLDVPTLPLDNAVRRRLGEIAVEMGAIRYFENVFRHPEILPRLSALNFFSLVSDPSLSELLPIFEEVLFYKSDAKSYEISWAIQGLQNMRTAASEDMLIRALSLEKTVILAMDALAETGSERALKPLEEAREFLRKVGEEKGIDLLQALQRTRFAILKRTGKFDERIFQTTSPPYDWFMDHGYLISHEKDFTAHVYKNPEEERKGKDLALIQDKGPDPFVITIYDDRLLAQIKKDRPWVTEGN